MAGLPVEVAACLATPAGVRWLHQLVVMYLIITLRAGAGVRLVCKFLELSGLSVAVGASYGHQYAVTVQVQETVAKPAQEQRVLLAVGMPPRELAVCEDETFHPDVCLVAIEPVSNLILVEQYAGLDHKSAKGQPAHVGCLAQDHVLQWNGDAGTEQGGRNYDQGPVRA